MEAPNLRSGFLSSLAEFPERPCLAIGAESYSYRQLAARARSIAATIDRHSAGSASARSSMLTAVAGHRHVTAFAGILAALLRGDGYVPLNPTFPLARTRAMLERSGSSTLVVDPSLSSRLPALLAGFPRSLSIVVPDLSDAQELDSLSAGLRGHRVIGAAEMEPAEAHQLGAASASDIAYLLFTSGSTGQPKGVMVSHRNASSFLEVVLARYGITEQDRLSQTFDLTFDLSVFDMFCAWARGACVCVPTQQQKLFPAQYLKQHELTVWFSVPSTAALMGRLGMLKPGSYQSLRLALFCGEGLPLETASRFAAAAPGAIVENLYGPTELTIACTVFRWDGELAACENGLVPIGEPYPGMRAIVVDEDLRPVPAGEVGELLLAGPQVTLGYWQDAEQTAKAFVVPPDEHEVFYRTGDRVRWPSGGPLTYLGRLDNQLKIQGYRVELGEIEAVLREASQVETVVVGWPASATGAEGLVAFVQAPVGLTVAERTNFCESLESVSKRRLPSYMQPARVLLLDEFPLNANGKVDRRALRALLDTEGSSRVQCSSQSRELDPEIRTSS